MGNFYHLGPSSKPLKLQILVRPHLSVNLYYTVEPLFGTEPRPDKPTLVVITAIQTQLNVSYAWIPFKMALYP